MWLLARTNSIILSKNTVICSTQQWKIKNVYDPLKNYLTCEEAENCDP